MKKSQKYYETYIEELEERIIDLSLKLKATNNLLADKATKHNKLISALTHNLKNPIGIAYSFSEMMSENAENYPKDKLEKHLEIVKESSQYAISLLNTFVTYHQVNSANYLYNFKLEEYTELINNVINNNMLLLQNKHITVVKNLPNNAILINIDSEKITLVLKQLLRNAIRFSEPNSKITISVTTSSTAITTQIIDEGIGISKNDLANVFNDFFVVNTYDVDKKKCIGLGLSIAQNIIKKHNGTLSIHSTINQGSTVTITLPICK
ncbi:MULTISPECIES: sensor histidine kinase [Flavobacteriaceae]|uniref:histidine kinase n=2 Tax=Flavobacteriaceae TaxID=49546 RepID=A0A4Y8ARD5_9FLAO|nr:MULTISPECIES: HAMP domain-containing sensor histidine kinase [Flavobacteriaceae]TEW73765.1 HAMP domain-containing histidine kinase [Gramella jeungdoensis]GGK37388.1 hypothetical protein GCM10007963_01820 [Lutibacter litoralis]